MHKCFDNSNSIYTAIYIIVKNEWWSIFQCKCRLISLCVLGYCYEFIEIATKEVRTGSLILIVLNFIFLTPIQL